MNYNTLRHAVESASGLRLRLRLQPLYGPGEIIFPCTVAGGKYQSSKRRIPGYPESIDCTIIDSVQSQANRMEDALLTDIRNGNISLPYVVTDFSECDSTLVKPIGEITCFEAPHRIFDAIIRDSVDANGIHFPFTTEGKSAINANSRDASALFEISPASLLFGSWDSTGVSGGLGEKYTRCIVSELVAINIEKAVRSGTRVDPLNSAKESFAEVMKKDGKDDVVWKMLADKAAAKKKKLENSSDINHGSVPWDGGSEKEPHGGITCDYIQQSTTISLPALRQLGFPFSNPERSAAARTVLAAIALHAAALNVSRGWHLRSRCDLTLDDDQAIKWEIIGESYEAQSINASDTRKLLLESIEAAKACGLPWRSEPIRLKPSKALTELVKKSQDAHRTSTSEE